MSDYFDNDDDFTIEQDEQFQEVLRQINAETKRSKALMLNPKKVFEINQIMSKLKHLLQENGFEYKINFESIDCFPTEATVNIEVESFGIAPKDYNIFKEVINSIDDFSVNVLTDGNLRMLFSIQNMFIEIRSESNGK